MNIIYCPNCNIAIEVVELNCCIFRCGIMKDTFVQIPPHLNKEECLRLVENNLIFGCGSPFRIQKIDDTFVASICDYI